MSTFKISALSPIRFHNAANDDFAYNKIPSFEYSRGYRQIYFHGDRPFIQILSSTTSAIMSMALIDNARTVYKSWSIWSNVAAFEDYHIYAFVHSLPFSNIAPEGVYFLRLTIVDSSGSATLYSEPIYLCSSFANTVKLIYSHDENDFDYQFTSSNIYPSMLRVEGGMKSDGLAPGGKYTMFQDQDYNSVMLNSQPYNVEKWTFGPSYGMPNHMADLLNRIFALSDVTIDGVAYSRNEGAKLERAGDTEYPLAGWSIDLVKTENPYSYAFQTAAIPLTADTIDYTADNALLTADQTEL